MGRQSKARVPLAAAERARFWLDKATDPTVDHEFLSREDIPPAGLFEYLSMILAPLRTVERDLVNLQRIYRDGTRRFIEGGQIDGAFWSPAEEIPSTGTLIIVDRVETAAAVLRDMNLPAVAAMTPENKLCVAAAIREKFPNLVLVISEYGPIRTMGRLA